MDPKMFNGLFGHVMIAANVRSVHICWRILMSLNEIERFQPWHLRLLPQHVASVPFHVDANPWASNRSISFLSSVPTSVIKCVKNVASHSTAFNSSLSHSHPRPLSIQPRSRGHRYNIAFAFVAPPNASWNSKIFHFDMTGFKNWLSENVKKCSISVWFHMSLVSEDCIFIDHGSIDNT